MGRHVRQQQLVPDVHSLVGLPDFRLPVIPDKVHLLGRVQENDTRQELIRDRREFVDENSLVSIALCCVLKGKSYELPLVPFIFS